MVRLDRDMFEKALLNLMLNAEDAMPNGGTLTLQARCEGAFVVLDIIDTVREPLWPRIGKDAPEKASARPRTEVEAELLESMVGVPHKRLRARIRPVRS